VYGIGLQCCATHSNVISMPGEILKGHLDMLLLSTLRSEPAHGYAVVERLGEMSEGAFALGEGTVYPALRRLEKAGMLRSSWVTVKGRDRRIYEVTAKGEKALAAKRRDWELFSQGVRRTLGTS
jgi:PadR family transcriptional regulator, regulatory protein PadR